MPELPEVETSRRGIEPYLVGKTLLHSVVRNSRLRWPVAPEVCSLSHQQVKSVQRRAKYLLLELSAGWIIIHLGMSGSLRIVPHALPAARHDHIDLVINNGKSLRYTDPRRFGAWLWSDSPYDSNVLAHLGPEPLSDDFNADWLQTQSRNKRMAIKPWLMDNRLVVGVGNIYASESLYMAGISPDRPAASLSNKEAARLVGAIKTVLQHAIEQGGTTLRDFLQTDGRPGYFAQQLRVYGQKGKPCGICGTEIASIRQAQRSTFYCPLCQK